VFTQSENSAIKAMYRSGSFAGIKQPLSYEKIPWYDEPDFVNEFLLSFIPVFLLSSLLAFVIWPCIYLLRKFKPNFLKKSSVHPATLWFSAAFGFLSFIYTLKFIARIVNAGGELLYGLPDEVKRFNLIPLVLLILLPALSWFTIGNWIKKRGRLFAKIYYTIYMLCSLIFIIFLCRWNFIAITF
jgi:hypothetical protein